jgi:cytochrome c oxidase accessory protein FixG
MEMVFRKIEYLIEGDHIRQKKLNNMPWNVTKTVKKLLKYSIFYIISILISNIFLAYIIGTDQLIRIITEPVSQHLFGFIAMLIFSAVFYWVFASFREQVCTIVCPYGRLQGVLLDPNSVVIAYDFVRGEPRGKIKKNGDRILGDCVDCSQCVYVCPTGIDIRNGTQLECVNCTCCIDACDSIMDNMKRPKGLIRYASFNNIKNNLKFRFTPRIIGYSALLTILVTVLVTLIVIRSDVSVTILRTPGLLYQEQPNNMISNLYSIKLANRTFRKISVWLQLVNIRGEIKIVGNEISVNEYNVSDSKFFINLHRNEIKKMNTPVEIAVYSGDKKIEIVKTSFLGPNPKEDK